MRKVCYFRDIIETRRGAVDNVIIGIKSEWSKFRDLVPLLASRVSPLEIKSILSSTFAHITMLYGI